MRGQNQAGPAAATVILTGLFIILYILFLPPADREALIGNATASTSDVTVVDHYDRLVNESPGLVTPQKSTSETRNLNTFTLTAKGSYVPVFTYGSTDVYSSRYDRKAFERSFNVDAIPSDARMSLSLDDVHGPLRVLINGQEVYSGTPASRTNKQILDLPLVQGSNKITIESGERWWIFGRNSAQISSISVVANVYSPSVATSTQSFSLPSQNRQYLKRAYITFLLSCDGSSSVQPLMIWLNGRLVTSTAGSSFDCESQQQIELDPSAMSDYNTLQFKTTTGVAVVQSPTIRFLYDQAVYPLYYFNVNASQYTDLQSNTKDAKFYMKFVRTSDDKDLIADINGNYVSVLADPGQTEFKTDVTRYIEQGENYVQIEPRKSANIVKLQVYLVAAK